MSSVNEKFCLKWNDFKQNITSANNELRDTTEFSDVTLVCEDNYQVEAHRVILFACSEFFKTIFRNAKHTHPLIYMKGTKAKNLIAILDFIYQGEAQIIQEDLENFLELAEELQIKGLTGDTNTGEPLTNSNIEKYVEPENVEIKRHLKVKSTKTEQIFEESPSKTEYEKRIVSVSDDLNLKAISAVANDELDDQILSIMTKLGGKWTCTLCGKIARDKTNLATHIEAKHIEGASHACNQCGKVSRSRHALAVHISAYHKLKYI